MLDFEIDSLIKKFDEKKYLKYENLTVLESRALSKKLISRTHKELPEFSSIETVTLTKENSTLFRNTLSTNQDYIVYIHGGGFVLHDVFSYQQVIKHLSIALNKNIIAINYLKAPEFSYNEICNSAFIQIQESLKITGKSVDNMIMLGDSAGANICLNYPDLSKIKQLHLIYPWLNFSLNTSSYKRLRNEGHLFLSEEVLKWFRDQLVFDNKDYKDLNSDKKLFPNLPETFVYAMGYDRLFDDALNFSKTNDVSFQNYKTLVHGSLFYFDYCKSSHKILTDIKENIN